MVASVTQGEDTIVITARGEADGAACPACGNLSRRVQSRYVRQPSDLPWVLSGWRDRAGHGSVPGMTTATNPYRGFRCPAEVIEHAVWLYYCFSLSLRDVELILAARGVVVSYESIREWGLRFGRLFANTLKRRRPRLGDKWHLDEVFIRIRGKQHYLWRAVDQNGHVWDILVQSRRNTRAAKRFFRKLQRGLQYVPQVIVADKLKSYGAAKRDILPHVEHRQSKYLNNCIEVSHQPTRRRERQMQRFKSARHPSSSLPPALQAEPLLLPPNASCLPTPASTTTSSSAAIASPPRNTVPLVTMPFASGARWSTSRL